MPEYFVKKRIDIEVRVICGDLGTAETLAGCLDSWCVDLTKPLPGKQGYELLPLGSFFHQKQAATPSQVTPND